MGSRVQEKASLDRFFEDFYRSHRHDVYRFALRDVQDPEEAEDVTQIVFLNAYRAFKRGAVPATPRPWLLAIAHNVARQGFRTRSRRREAELDPEFVAAAPEYEGPTGPEITDAMRRLPPNQRTVIVLREIAGLSYSEIADRLSRSVSAVETLLFRARRSLRNELAADEGVGRRRGRVVVPWPLSDALRKVLEWVGVGLVRRGVAAKIAGAVGAGVLSAGAGVITVEAATRAIPGAAPTSLEPAPAVVNDEGASAAADLGQVPASAGASARLGGAWKPGKAAGTKPIAGTAADEHMAPEQQASPPLQASDTGAAGAELPGVGSAAVDQRDPSGGHEPPSAGRPAPSSVEASAAPAKPKVALPELGAVTEAAAEAPAPFLVEAARDTTLPQPELGLGGGPPLDATPALPTAPALAAPSLPVDVPTAPALRVVGLTAPAAPVVTVTEPALPVVGVIAPAVAVTAALPVIAVAAPAPPVAAATAPTLPVVAPTVPVLLITGLTAPLATAAALAEPLLPVVPAAGPSLPVPGLPAPLLPVPSFTAPSLAPVNVTAPSLTMPSLPTPSLAEVGVTAPSLTTPSLPTPSLPEVGVTAPSLTTPSVPTPSPPEANVPVTEPTPPPAPESDAAAASSTKPEPAAEPLPESDTEVSLTPAADVPTSAPPESDAEVSGVETPALSAPQDEPAIVPDLNGEPDALVPEPVGSAEIADSDLFVPVLPFFGFLLP